MFLPGFYARWNSHCPWPTTLFLLDACCNANSRTNRQTRCSILIATTASWPQAQNAAQEIWSLGDRHRTRAYPASAGKSSVFVNQEEPWTRLHDSYKDQSISTFILRRHFSLGALMRWKQRSRRRRQGCAL